MHPWLAEVGVGQEAACSQKRFHPSCPALWPTRAISRIDLFQCVSHIFRYVASAWGYPRWLGASAAAAASFTACAGATSSADRTTAALDRSRFWIELRRTQLDRLEWAMSGLIGVGVPRVVQLETGAERPSYGWRLRFGESDTVQRRAGGGDLGGDCFVVGDQLCGTLLNVGGVHLCLGRSCHTGSRRCDRKILAHKVSGAAGFVDRIQHAALGRIERLGSPPRYRRRFMQHISQPPHLHQIGEGSFLGRLGGDALPHRPTRRHGRPMNRRERSFPMLGSGLPVRRRTL